MCSLLSLVPAACFSGPKDKAAPPTSSFPRLSASDDQLSPVSPSSVFLSTSEEPSSPKTFASNDVSKGDPRGSGSADDGQANRSRGQQLLHHSQKRAPNPSTYTTQAARANSESASPGKATEGQTDPMEQAQSPPKTERGHGGSQDNVTRERKAQGQRHRRSSSPRKSSKKERDPANPSRNLEEPQSPRRPAGQQPGASTVESKDRKQRGEDATHQQERGATESGGKSSGASQRHRKGKRAEKETRSDASAGPVSRKTGSDRGDRQQETAEDVSEKNPTGSSSSIQDPNCNGTNASKKAPITPGPWKVPSSAKIQSKVDTTYADV